MAQKPPPRNRREEILAAVDEALRLARRTHTAAYEGYRAWKGLPAEPPRYMRQIGHPDYVNVKYQAGGSNPFGGKPPGCTNKFPELGLVKALKSLKHRVPKDASEIEIELAARAFVRIVQVMDREIVGFEAATVLKAAVQVREEICGPIARNFNFKAQDSWSQILEQAEDTENDAIVKAEEELRSAKDALVDLTPDQDSAAPTSEDSDDSPVESEPGAAESSSEEGSDGS